MSPYFAPGIKRYTPGRFPALDRQLESMKEDAKRMREARREETPTEPEPITLEDIDALPWRALAIYRDMGAYYIEINGEPVSEGCAHLDDALREVLKWDRENNRGTSRGGSGVKRADT